jgi:Hemopexin
MKISHAGFGCSIALLLTSLAGSAKAQEDRRLSYLQDLPIRIRLEFLVLTKAGKPSQLQAPPEYVQRCVVGLNEIYKPAGIQFDFDPATDFRSFSDASPYRRKPQEITTPDGTSIDTQAIALNREARPYSNKLVLWVVSSGIGGYSGTNMDYVYFRMNETDRFADTGMMSHETGHYLGLGHTHDPTMANYFGSLMADPKKNAAALTADAIKEKLRKRLSERYARAPDKDPLAALDADSPAIKDTPYDPSGGIWHCIFPDALKPGQKLELTLDAPKSAPGKTLRVTVAPDTTNMMGYYASFGPTISPDQRAIVRQNILRGTRSALLHTAAVNWENGKVYFFKGDRFLRYDLKQNRADLNFPQRIFDHWEMPFRWNVDAGFVVGKKAYFFSGDHYVEYDTEKEAFDPNCLVAGYPPTMAERWSGWPDSWKGHRVDAAVNWYNGKAYFFSGPECLSYDLEAKKIDDGYPRKIAEEFPGLPFTDNLDSVIVIAPNRTYFFAGNRWCIYSPEKKEVVSAFENFRGDWPDIWSSNLSGALYTSHTEAYFFQESQYIPYNPFRNQPETDMTTFSKPLSERWHLPWNHLDGCANWTNHQALFFEKSDTLLYDLQTNKVIGATQKFAQRFQQWPAAWNDGADSAVLWNDGRAFFFRKDQFLVVDAARGIVTKPPAPIAGNWKDWPATWKGKIGAIMPYWGDGEKGKMVFFSGSEYLRFDVASNAVEGSPRRIAEGQWPGLTW